ncbi:MAG: hypothetical protein E7589_06825 [Ruminococcaceae bacterium]|nr:hypothetical protein [Oscillospiraceae bacterium]
MENKALLKIAKVIRVVSVPPVMVTALIIILALSDCNVFTSVSQSVVSVLCLGLLPLLAYPISYAVPKIREKGRDGQRDLAIYLSAVGYAVAVIYGHVTAVSSELMLIYYGYFISVILIALSKLIKVKASGHACSVSGPIVYIAYFLGFGGIISGVALWGLILFASLYLKRHTLSEFLLGTGVCIVAFTTSWLIFGM